MAQVCRPVFSIEHEYVARHATMDGNYLVSDTAMGMIYLRKETPDSMLIWEYSYAIPTPGVLSLPKIEEIPSGGFYLAGIDMNAVGAPVGRFYVLRIDADGNLIWVQKSDP